MVAANPVPTLYRSLAYSPQEWYKTTIGSDSVPNEISIRKNSQEEFAPLKASNQVEDFSAAGSLVVLSWYSRVSLPIELLLPKNAKPYARRQTSGRNRKFNFENYNSFQLEAMR